MTLGGRFYMVDFRLGLYTVDFTWTSYSRVYMIIKNEVKFSLSGNNFLNPNNQTLDSIHSYGRVEVVPSRPQPDKRK